MRNFLLCATLIALLALQPASAQDTYKIPIPLPAATTTPASVRNVLADGTEIRFVLLDSISSATAVKGQPVRFAVAQDVIVNGIAVIPRGTQAEGVVTQVRKGIPDKHDGALQLEARKILLTDGTKLKLVRSTEDCQITIPGCWVFGAFVVGGVAIFGPIALGVAAVHSISHPHHRRVLTPIHSKIEGTDEAREPCEIDTAYTAHEWKISPGQTQASGSATEAILKTLDTCAAH